MLQQAVADISRWLVLAALGITVVTALVYTSGPIGTPEVTPDAYWSVFGRDISKFDWSYLGTFSRAGGLLLVLRCLAKSLAIAYMASGAETPSKSRPLATTCRTASLRATRALRLGASSTSILWALYQV